MTSFNTSLETWIAAMQSLTPKIFSLKRIESVKLLATKGQPNTTFFFMQVKNRTCSNVDCSLSFSLAKVQTGIQTKYVHSKMLYSSSVKNNKFICTKHKHAYKWFIYNIGMKMEIVFQMMKTWQCTDNKFTTIIVSGMRKTNSKRLTGKTRSRRPSQCGGRHTASHSQHKKNWKRFWKKCRWMDWKCRNKQGRNPWQ